MIKIGELIRLKTYEINPHTLAVVPIWLNNQLCSIVYEFDQDMIVEMRPFQIVKHSCNYFGQSYEGRKEGTKALMGATHKPPIILETSTRMYLFPTSSPKRDDCAWLLHSHIIEYYSSLTGTTNVVFSNNKMITLDISVGSFKNQLTNTAQLSTIIERRIEKSVRKLNFYLGDRKRY